MSAPTDSSDPLIGQNVNGYVVEGRLGEGGMGLVYQCLQPDIGKRAALKVLRPEVSGDPEIVSRLVSEARAVNAIRHRGIVDIFGYAKLPDGRQAIIMEFLEGRSLEDELHAAAAEHRTLPLKRVLQVADEVLNALGAAHKAGVIHRDLKPSNIFLCRSPNGEEHLKLLDFGIARMGVVNQTKASVVLGTPSYMAPEQARGESVGPALDLYAIGVILFELLTGRLPYIADNAVRVIYMHLEAPIPRPSSINPAIPGAFDEIVTKLLAKRTHERFESAEALRRELLRIKVALSDPSALTTIEEPIAPFDGTQPIERTFVRATPATDIDRTGVLGAPGGAASSSSQALADAARPPTAPPAGALSSSTGVAPASASPAATNAGPNRAADPSVTDGLGVAAGANERSRQRDDATRERGVDHAVRRSRGPLVGVAALAVVMGAGVFSLRDGSQPPTPPQTAPAVAPPVAAGTEALASPPAVAPLAAGPAPSTPAAQPAPPPPSRTPPASSSSRSGGSDRSLERRLDHLNRRVEKAKARGADTDVAERQLAVVRSKLTTATTEEARSQLEAILDRIANDLESP